MKRTVLFILTAIVTCVPGLVFAGNHSAAQTSQLGGEGTRAAVSAPAGFVPIEGNQFIVDLQYAKPDNFLHRAIYAEQGVDRCWLHPEAAGRLAKLAPLLAKRHLKLLLWDCWRPAAVQREMWKLVPDERYVANPAKGSNHNRGLALDATLAHEDGTELSMPTGFDDFSVKASPTSRCDPGDRERCEHRDVLIRLMREAGFEVFPTEWWHFQPRGVDLATFPVY